MEKEGEEEQQNTQSRNQNNRKVVIQIPSYQEVIDNSQPKPSQANSNLFKPSQTFSQAFSFIKNTEFYTPPPPPQPSATSSFSQQGLVSINASTSSGVASSPSPSASAPSAAAATSSSSQSNQSRNAILVSHRQKGNPLLKHIRNVRWAFADVVCDYLLGQSSCALYLSLRYHLLHPDYLYYRIRELQKNYKLRVVLCHVDVEDVVKPLLEVTKTALLHDCTLLCAWSLEECGRYLETIKMYENKPADLIQGQMDTDYLSRLNHALTTVRHVNKTDVVTLGSTFGSLSNIMDASMEDLARCPGIGERKVKRLYDTFHEPFKRVVPSHPVIPETPVQKDAEPSLPNEVAEVEKEDEGANKRRKTEPEVTVKSALSSAFAKYADKFGKKDKRLHERKAGKTSVAAESEPGDDDFTERAPS
ncbi:Excision repair cross-complementation group 1 [Turnera subulata]|uniref:DNA excision repair protein ERCC-1 n=1 Tax=Turnera subulata TaxID=218843 RepID=A0A9Q0J7U2_9ROSI|nr:Excision repair cross-complementation group 1 [Turnera subulata]